QGNLKKSLESHSLRVRVALCATLQVATDRGEVASAAINLASRRVRRGLLIDPCRLVAIVPPGFGDAARVARLRRGPTEYVPIGEPVRGLVPVRNPIAASADHSIEYPAGHRQARAAIGCDDLVDKRIDDWIGNAGEILRALHCGGLRGKITPQRVAGRARKGEPLNREVEVEIIDPFAILYRVNNAQSRLDAQRPEILDERHVMRLKRRLVYQEFDADWLTLQRHPLAVLDDKAGLLQERAGLAQQRTILTRSIGNRWNERFSEHLIGHLAAE